MTGTVSLVPCAGGRLAIVRAGEAGAANGWWGGEADVGLVALIVVGAAVVTALTGGRWHGFTTMHLHGKGLVAGAVAAQLLGALVADHTSTSWCYTAGLAASAACALAFCLANLRVAGIPLVAVGLVCNAVVVARNGTMPVSLYEAHRAGVSTLSIASGDDPRHALAGKASVWRNLGDVIPVPLPAVPEVVSPGDVLVAAGLGEFVFVTSRRRRDSDDQAAGGESSQAFQALSTIAPRS